MRTAFTAFTALLLAAALAGCGSTPPPPTVLPLAVSPPTAQASPESSPAREVAVPVRIRIPSLGVDAKVVKVGLKPDGSMETPEFGFAGWYTEGPKPGEVGPAVVVAHVDSKSGPDVFARLKTLPKGAKIEITDKRGKTYEFVARSKRQTDKDELPTKAIWGETDGPALRLITCGGAFDRKTNHYLANVVVFADAG